MTPELWALAYLAVGCVWVGVRWHIGESTIREHVEASPVPPVGIAVTILLTVIVSVVLWPIPALTMLAAKLGRRDV